jgi:hypothetical protein
MKTRIRPTPLNPVDIWHAEHVYFRRLLELLKFILDHGLHGLRRMNPCKRGST